ncbi:MAG: L,D-transpeptidase [Pseudomonadota bacterium]
MWSSGGRFAALAVSFTAVGAFAMVAQATTAAATEVTAAPKLRSTITVAALEQPSAEKIERAPVTKAPRAAKPRRKRRGPAVIATIDLTSQRMTIVEHGKHTYSWKISSGRAGFITPRGTFRPTWKSRMHYSRKYNNAPMPYSVFFNGGIATHGTTAVGRLGRPASHGCIRLRTPNARRFYQLVSKYGHGRVRIVVRGTTPLRTRRTVRKRRQTRRAQGHRTRSVRRVSRAQTRRARTVRRVRRSTQRRVVRRARPAKVRTSGLRFPGDAY